jgi:adenylyltransferase/sulfurtransferase
MPDNINLKMTKAELLGMNVPYLDPSSLKDVRLLITGAGAIGGAVFDMAVRYSIGKIGLVDMDRVEPHNAYTGIFNEQDIGRYKVFALKERFRNGFSKSSVSVHAFPVPVQLIGMGFFLNYDAALVCLDNLKARVNAHRKCMKAGIPACDAGIDLENGRMTHVDPAGPCYECGLKKTDYSKWDIAYPCAKKDNGSSATISPASMSFITAGASLNSLLRRLYLRKNKKSDIYKGKEILITEGGSCLSTFRIKENENCLSMHHSINSMKIEKMDFWNSSTTTLRDVMRDIRNRTGNGHGKSESFLNLETDLVTQGKCNDCGKIWKPCRTFNYLDIINPECPFCRKKSDHAPVEIVSILPLNGTDYSFLDRTLADLGFPLFHIFTLMSSVSDPVAFQVSGDDVFLLASETGDFPDSYILKKEE